MKHNFISRISIYLLSVVMIVFGLYHFFHPKNMLIYVPAYVPGGILWVYLVGTSFILVAISFVLRRQVKLAAYLLALLLVVFIITIHLPNYMNAGDAEMRQIALVNLLKDTAIAGFALHIASNTHTHELNVKY